MKAFRSPAAALGLILACCAPLAGAAQAESAPPREAIFDYRLAPQRIADGVYVLVGPPEDFSPRNGGNIGNTGFIVGTTGVIVIDTGPSRRYGEQLRAAIARITPLPVVLTLNTHHHPDHFLGNQAFPPDTLAALPETIAGIEAEGEAFNANLYRLAGNWMSGTEVVVPRQRLSTGRQRAGGRDIELLALGGHTAADLVLIDHATGTVFASDLLFHGRAPTTPHADIPRWLESLDTLIRLPAQRWVSGHGEPATDSRPLAATRAYLVWLRDTIRASAASGADMAEALARPLPAEIRTWTLAESEYRRSVAHLFPAAERAVLEASP